MKYLLCILPYIAFYLIGSFVAVSFDISEWTTGLRGHLVFAANLASFFLAVLIKSEAI